MRVLYLGSVASTLALLAACAAPSQNQCDVGQTTPVIASYTKDGMPVYLEPEPIGPNAARCATQYHGDGDSDWPADDGPDPDTDEHDEPESDEPDVEEPDVPQEPEEPEEPVTPDKPKKQKSDNSDANGKGGNKHDRKDKTKRGTETAEQKKE